MRSPEVESSSQKGHGKCVSLFSSGTPSTLVVHEYVITYFYDFRVIFRSLPNIRLNKTQRSGHRYTRGFPSNPSNKQTKEHNAAHIWLDHSNRRPRLRVYSNIQSLAPPSASAISSAELRRGKLNPEIRGFKTSKLHSQRSLKALKEASKSFW